MCACSRLRLSVFLPGCLLLWESYGGAFLRPSTAPVCPQEEQGRVGAASVSQHHPHSPQNLVRKEHHGFVLLSDISPSVGMLPFPRRSLLKTHSNHVTYQREERTRVWSSVSDA